ncbi:MAG: DUF3313 family protein [Candidatus Omnitrophota bacterium]
MGKIWLVITVAFLLSGCAAKMAFLNTQKTAEDVQRDRANCQSIVDASDFKDSDLKQKKFNQCMKDKGYNVVSEGQAEKIQGFKGLWVKPEVDFKAYDAIFIGKVDLSQAKIKNTNIPDTKVSDEDINNLGEEMLKRFSKALSVVMPIITDREAAAGEKFLYINLKLDNISQTNIGLNAALEVAGKFTPVPLPDGPEGVFSFEGAIVDYSNKEKLMTISDEVKSGKNSSLAGFEKFSHWQCAYNIMDYWADHLAALLAKERGQKYKSQLGFKLINF